MNNGRISLADNFQRKKFLEAMHTLGNHKRELSPYDTELRRKMVDGWNLAKRELTLTVKQLNYLCEVARQLDEGTYGG